ncbi:hypothetical protein F5Y03DRAFT_349685 [Xylaria venustula]|nr:hypothetical protein F5Y03DRAFT_349685 [Xylaria venustula]
MRCRVCACMYILRMCARGISPQCTKPDRQIPTRLLTMLHDELRKGGGKHTDHGNANLTHPRRCMVRRSTSLISRYCLIQKIVVAMLW